MVSKKQLKLDAFNKEYRKISRIKFEDDIDQDVEDFKDLMPHFKEYVDPTEYKAIFANVDADSSRADDFLRILKEAKEELEQSCAPVDSVDKMDDDEDIDPHDELETKSDIDFIAEGVEYATEKDRQKAERRLRKGANAEELYRQQQNQMEAEEEKHLERIIVKPAAPRALMPSASFAQTASKRTSFMDTKDIDAVVISDNDDNDQDMKDGAGTESDDPGAEAEGEGEPEVKPNSKKRIKTSASAAAPKTEARVYQFGETFFYKGNEYKVTDGPRREKIPLLQVEGKLQPDWDNIEYDHLTTVHGRNPNKKDVVDYHNFVQADGMVPVFVTGELAKRIDNAYKKIPNQVHPSMKTAKESDNLVHFKNGAIRTVMCMANYRALTKTKADKKNETANRLGKVKVSAKDREQASHCLTLLKTEFKECVQQFEQGFQPLAVSFDTPDYLANLQEALELMVNMKKSNNMFKDFISYYENTDPSFLQKFIVFSSVVFPGWRKANENYLSCL